ncbi:FG-GAP repeat domain-containing protein [Longispora albida]|uniref:FG-GAP repeat domain-containing protein n=1 Tax=Longispora albida TaxID=203523 RepID=UPI00036BD111|nr:VCBS repeat-containing protein [Longispora albida]
MKRLGTLTALAVAALALPATTAHAEPVSTILYVNSESSSCSDTGPGTDQFRPFCKVQPAVDAAQPGQTVRLLGHIHKAGSLTFKRSGTAAAPITIEAPQRSRIYLEDGGLTIPAGVNHIRIERLDLWSTGNGSSLIAGDDVFVDRAYLVTALLVTGDRVRVQRTYSHRSIVFDGAADAVLSTSAVRGYSARPLPVVVRDSPRAVITSNTISAIQGALTLSGASSGAFLANNVFRTEEESIQAPFLTVDASSAVQTTARYNALERQDSPVYSWGGGVYRTAAEFQAATGQGQADVMIARLPASVIPHELIDSADALAPGQLGTDLPGRARVRNPNVPEATGTGVGHHDRGAYEASYTAYQFSEGFVRPVKSAGGLTAEWSDVSYTASWGTVTIKVTYDWGDGTKETLDIAVPPLVDGKTASAQLPNRTHTYAKPGSYFASISTTDGTTTDTGGDSVSVGPEHPQGTLLPGSSQFKADFNGDGRADVAMFYDYGNGHVALWGMDGLDGGLGPVTLRWEDKAWGKGTRSVTAGDFNGDGKADLGFLYDFGVEGLAFLTMTSNGSGGFGAPKPVWWGGDYWGQLRFASTGDFDGNGRTDFAIFRQLDSSWVQIDALLVQPDGGVRNAGLGLSTWGSGTRAMSAGDFNGDGRTDLGLFYDYGDGHVATFALTAGPNGSYFEGPSTLWDAPQWGRGTKFVQSGNFDGDSKTDFALFYDYGGGHIAAFSLTPQGALKTMWDGPVWGGGTKFLAAGAYTAKDGRDDLALFYDYGGSHQALFTLTPKAGGGYTGPVQRWNAPYWGGGTRALF